ncbi:hypothetical protein FY557_16025 [Chryseobacterium sp. SN22]|uniref:hypothetical protein n=1 Tax=Chryseobacterium sp. SN22 TaxID=2606431 RepID=UPI0011F09276|nr:hypothetical protein [Chryseobacterium sp. SN22]KAA0126683.1 hypothetical protein FY557_16025 [Chryseobacterium sp. SN22]
MSKPESILDTLLLASKLQAKIGDFSRSEIQFFAYLSCLLSLYDGHTVFDWNCQFIKSDLGSPYSADIDSSMTLLLSNASIVETEKDFFKITEKGLKNLNFFRTQKQLSWRCVYLETSCKSLSILPHGVIKEALINEPVVSSARNSHINKNLLEDANPATKALYIQFASLKSALDGQYRSLIGPAVVWIESLNTNHTLLNHDN